MENLECDRPHVLFLHRVPACASVVARDSWPSLDSWHTTNTLMDSPSWGSWSRQQSCYPCMCNQPDTWGISITKRWLHWLQGIYWFRFIASSHQPKQFYQLLFSLTSPTSCADLFPLISGRQRIVFHRRTKSPANEVGCLPTWIDSVAYGNQVQFMEHNQREVTLTAKDQQLVSHPMRV